MKTIYHHHGRRVLAALAAGLILGGGAVGVSRAAEYRPTIWDGVKAVVTNAPGGVPARPIITSIAVTSSNATLTWYGMEGWYTVIGSTNSWATSVDLGRTAVSAHNGSLIVTHPFGSAPTAQFDLKQDNGYAGAGNCSSCHGDKYQEWSKTAHASAYAAITNATAQAAELVYRSVGQGQGGFVNTNTTPALANVGCEACHGPAAWHRYSDHDLIRPVVSMDPQICGGCHATTDRPTYTEYTSIINTPTGPAQVKHSLVNLDIKYGSALATNYFTNKIAMIGTNVVPVGTPGSVNVYGYFVTRNSSGGYVTNLTTGIIHSGNGPGSGNVAYNAGLDPGLSRALSCGICHSAANRSAMIQDYEERLQGRTNVLVGAAAVDGASWTATCVTCHDPHSDAYPSQMRYPLWSTNYYTQPTTTDLRTNAAGGQYYMNTPFAANYNPNIQVCGQCHNSRGARWDGLPYVVTPVMVTNTVTKVVYVNITTNMTYTNSSNVVTNGTVTITIASNSVTPGVVSTNYTFGLGVTPSYSRPPHHSPQYNILSGIIQPDYLGGTNIIGVHSLNTNGCAACHVHPEESPAITTGHTFEPEMANCSVSGCHDGINAMLDVATAKVSLQSEISNGINNLVTMLNNWSLAKGSALFGVSGFNTYKQFAWEYTGSGNWGSVGASAADQTNKVPVGIRQARFNLYILAYGQSYGIHNPTLSRLLLADASNKIATATGPLPVPTAFFTASATNVLTNAVVTFSNASTNGTSFTWNFGNGLTSTAVAPTTTYTNAGVYTVSLTASNATGSATYTRASYINVYNRSLAAFTSDVTNGVAPLTVNYTNQSAFATSYSWTLGGTNGASTAINPTATYDTNGTYTITLRAINPVWTNTLTKTNYISVP